LPSKGRRPIPLGDMLQRTNQVRGRFARLIGASPTGSSFLFATSERRERHRAPVGLTRGDNVVVDGLHYNTTFVLYRHLEQTTGVEAAHREGAERCGRRGGLRAAGRQAHATRLRRVGLASKRLSA
jgi:hypothetical protein